MKRRASTIALNTLLADKRARLGKEVMVRAELKVWFREAIEPDLLIYQSKHSQACAFNTTHENAPYQVSHYRSELSELMVAFLASHPGCEILRPREVWHTIYDEEWRALHNQRANLRILCSVCHRQAHPRYKESKRQPLKSPITTTTTKTIEQVLLPYNEKKKKSLVSHPWFDMKTWSPAPLKKGNYIRKLGNKSFQLYARHNKWLYVYDGKFSATAYDSLREVLKASYSAYGEEIRRYV